MVGIWILGPGIAPVLDGYAMIDVADTTLSWSFLKRVEIDTYS